MNVLLTCAGRRNYLVSYFKDALQDNGFVFAADSSADAPAMQEADRSFVVPPVNHPDYVSTLLDLCSENAVGLVISLNDLELPIIAGARERFLQVGTTPVVSPPDVVDICFDKWRTTQFLESIGVRVPATFISMEEATATIKRGELEFPLVVKPRWGSASIGIDFPEDLEELELGFHLSYRRMQRSILGQVSSESPGHALLIQQRIRGQEYGFDVVNDLKGNYVGTYIKAKLSMRAGETDRAVTVRDAGLEALGERIARSLRHIGNLDCDVIVNGDQAYVIELNPRFGGGYPFSHAAGLNLPAALVAWQQGEPCDPSWFAFQPGVRTAKYDRLVMIR